MLATVGVAVGLAVGQLLSSPQSTEGTSQRRPRTQPDTPNNHVMPDKSMEIPSNGLKSTAEISPRTKFHSFEKSIFAIVLSLHVIMRSQPKPSWHGSTQHCL